MTELIWDGKYDPATGKKIAPPRIALPFQTVETVNESTADRDRTADLFAAGGETEWRNRLIWGDKKYVLPSLLPEFAGKVNLIYIDPPFDTGANFSYMATVSDDPDLPDSPGVSFMKEPSVIERKAYRDTWGKGLDSYLRWFYETVVMVRELLTDDGTIYVHLDWHTGHYAKVVLDEVFGESNFVNELVWQKIRTTKAQTAGYGNVHDNLFVYRKGLASVFHKQGKDLDPKYIASHYKPDPNTGKKYRTVSLLQKGGGPSRQFGDQILVPPAGMHWIWSQERIDRAMSLGLIRFTSNGRPEKIQFLDDMDGDVVDDIWDDVFPINSQATEALGYPTQKPEALLDRVVAASSNPGDLVLDCFCGSGTTAAVAEKLGRRWITCDLGRFAIHTARKRLLNIEGVKPFVVQNLGKYERQAWQAAEFGENAAAITQAYREFILKLFGARPITGYIWLHGVKGGRMVHVGGVDAPVSVGDVMQIAAEFRRSRGSGSDAPTQNTVDILGWDFAFELNEVSKQQAAQVGVDVRFVKIPREVLEKKAVEQGDIKFFELAALAVEHKVVGRTVHLNLTDFVIPLDDVPQDVQKAISHWEQWIDYWAVDWHNKGDTFHNQWQSYRTRQSKSIQKVVVSPPDTYASAGTYKVVVKVIDILGNDTTKTIEVTVA